MPDALLSTERTILKEYLFEFFNFDELEDIVFDLSISLGSFGEGVTKSKFVRELISYCERHNLVDCLLLEIARRRDKAQDTLGRIIAKFQICSPRKKVQIILQADTLAMPIEQLIKSIARLCPGIKEEEIAIIAAARGSIRLLIGFSEPGAIKLLASVDQLREMLSINSVKSFDGLSKVDQSSWQAIAAKYPLTNHGNLNVIASWSPNAEISQEKRRKRTTILLAENDPKALQLIAYFLEDQGYTVLRTTNPSDARSKMMTQPVDIAVFNIRLMNEANELDKSGLTIAKKHIEGKPIPKIVMTNFPNYNLVIEALRMDENETNEIVDFIDKTDGLIPLLNAIKGIEGLKQWKLLFGIDQSFTEQELRDFFAEAGLDYSHLVGNKRDKISELLRYFEYGEGLASLISRLRKVKPNREWVLV